MKRIVTLIESRPRGWLYAERGSYYGTLANAQKVIAREDRGLAKEHGKVATVITYVANTDVGRAVVKALTEK